MTIQAETDGCVNMWVAVVNEAVATYKKPIKEPCVKRRQYESSQSFEDRKKKAEKLFLARHRTRRNAEIFFYSDACKVICSAIGIHHKWFIQKLEKEVLGKR